MFCFCLFCLIFFVVVVVANVHICLVFFERLTSEKTFFAAHQLVLPGSQIRLKLNNYKFFLSLPRRCVTQILWSLFSSQQKRSAGCPAPRQTRGRGRGAEVRRGDEKTRTPISSLHQIIIDSSNIILWSHPPFF